MSPQAQRIAIAEACGWKYIHSDGPPEHTLFGLHLLLHQADSAPVEIADYLNDLNAMHEAEKVLTELQWPRYITEPSKQCPNSWMPAATAAQRAEAFLKTIGKWEESA